MLCADGRLKDHYENMARHQRRLTPSNAVVVAVECGAIGTLTNGNDRHDVENNRRVFRRAAERAADIARLSCQGKVKIRLLIDDPVADGHIRGIIEALMHWGLRNIELSANRRTSALPPKNFNESRAAA